MIIPSIDLMGGKAVQLRQGKEKVLERDDVFDLVRDFSRFGDIAVIDLDAALGQGDNLSIIKKICRIADCRVGGGIRTVEKANEILQAGAKKIIIGTMAKGAFLKQLPKDRIIVAVDVRKGEVVDKGWTTKTGNLPDALLKELTPYCSEFLVTNVDREGMLQGTDVGWIKKLRKNTSNTVTIAGGISSLLELQEITALGMHAQLGMAIYTNTFTLIDGFIRLLDFKKGNGLIPTVVQDQEGQVLMLGFSSEESIRRTFMTNQATYFSRSRNKLWQKGEQSGNVQEFIKARFDCDQDALLYTVRQKNGACHKGTYSCFDDKNFSIESLYDVIKDRLTYPRQGSYTAKIGQDEQSIMKKILEEAQEIIDYRARNNLIWEIADITYFLLMLMAKKGIEPTEIRNELWRRRR